MSQDLPASGAATVTSVTVGTAAVTAAIPKSVYRRTFLSISNESATATVAFSLGSTTPAINTAGSWTLAAGASYRWDGSFVPMDQVNLIASASSTPVTIEAESPGV